MYVSKTMVMMFGSEALGRWSGPEGRGFINGIGAFIRDMKEMISLSLRCEDMARRHPSAAQEEGPHSIYKHLDFGLLSL